MKNPAHRNHRRENPDHEDGSPRPSSRRCCRRNAPVQHRNEVRIQQHHGPLPPNKATPAPLSTIDAGRAATSSAAPAEAAEARSRRAGVGAPSMAAPHQTVVRGHNHRIVAGASLQYRTANASATTRAPPSSIATGNIALTGAPPGAPVMPCSRLNPGSAEGPFMPPAARTIPAAIGGRPARKTAEPAAAPTKQHHALGDGGRTANEGQVASASAAKRN